MNETWFSQRKALNRNMIDLSQNEQKNATSNMVDRTSLKTKPHRGMRVLV